MGSLNKPIGQGGDMKLTRAVVAIGCALVLSCAAVLTGPAPAAAVATLYLSDGVNPTVTIADGSPGDACPFAGCVTFMGSIGVWLINVSTGISSSPFPHIDLNSVDVSTGAGTLAIKFGDTDFTLGAGPHTVNVGSLIGGTTAGSVTWQAGLNTSNLNPITGGCCDQLGALYGPLGPGAFSQTNLDTFSADGPFALELAVTITHAGAGTTSFDYEGRVPGPATLLLLGAGLLATGAMTQGSRAGRRTAHRLGGLAHRSGRLGPRLHDCPALVS